MRIYALLPTVLATSAILSSIAAQEPRIGRVSPPTVFPSGGAFPLGAGEQPRAVIGVATSSGATARDTLGVLVSSIRPGSPAEKAGIEEGNRIASINGVSLRLAAVDIGDDQMGGVLSRRLNRELDKLKPGDEVDLRVYASGQMKSLKVRTMAPADLYQARATRSSDDRPTLGINVAVTGSSRDTLGVFVFSVDDGGPAAKAGIEEGARIASINGVDIRGNRPGEDEDFPMRNASVSRLERELSRLKPGDDVDLRVLYNGQTRSVKLKTVRAGDLPHRNRSMTIIGGPFSMPDIAARIDGMRVDGARIGGQIRRVLGGAGGRTEW